MQIKHFMRGFTSMFVVATAFSTITLQAAMVRSEKVEIPFVFQVQRTVLPAGDYRVEYESGSDVATLINLESGKRVQILRTASGHKEGKALLFFTPNGDRLHLRKIS